jgi:hypothetical protein
VKVSLRRSTGAFMEVFSPAMDFEAVVVLVTSILLGLRPYLLIVLGIFIATEDAFLWVGAAQPGWLCHGLRG